jgi:hypothetical protein
MRPPIRAAIAVFLSKPRRGNRQRIDWTLVLAWTGFAIAMSIVILAITLR